ncbi:MarR family winged helix-turn-helix transcriptional regulator [Beijerinckia sp. L45]|uniref:MarR family winged helix-turn-helix transcriptional regulator n=1 Tax=Beijerinckia sp. L45 TaxID=1641855 RepID=UPI001AED98AD|nr:MarR family winged helix-turn-helix transcriptional regulator [Beijerinckia sp. L45]
MYDFALAPTGLRSTQMTVLAEINRQTDELLTVGELADALAMDRPTMGQNLHPLEREGLITIMPGDADQRRRHVVLTDAGQVRLTAAYRLLDRAQARSEERLGEKVAADLRRVLRTIVNDESLLFVK